MCDGIGVSSVLFVAALNHYNRVLFENESKNAMHESIELFGQIINSKWFVNSPIVLFLTKHDLFLALLMDEIGLDICFGKDNVSWCDYSTRIWNGPNYKKNKEKPGEDAKYFEFCRESAETFIKQCYLDENKHEFGKTRIYPHITNGMDQSNIERAFWDVQNICVRKSIGGVHANSFRGDKLSSF